MRRIGLLLLAASLTLAGCAPRCPRPDARAVLAQAQTQVTQEPPPPGWPPYYPPRLVRDLSGTDTRTGEAASIERGYVLHRIDVEKIRVMQGSAERCEEDLAACEQRVIDAAAPPGFWDAWEGRTLLLALGFLIGAGMTTGIALAVD